MMIQKIVRTVEKGMEHVAVKGANIRATEHFYNKMRTNEDFFQNVLLGTILAQMLYKVGIYTIVPLYNKGMPPEQRVLSSILALTNGAFQVGMMLPFGIFINRRSDRWAEKLFRHIKHNKKVYDLAKLGFRSFLTIGVSGVFAQKVLLQLVAMPMAQVIHNHFLTTSRK